MRNSIKVFRLTKCSRTMQLNNGFNLAKVLPLLLLVNSLATASSSSERRRFRLLNNASECVGSMLGQFIEQIGGPDLSQLTTVGEAEMQELETELQQSLLKQPVHVQDLGCFRNVKPRQSVKWEPVCPVRLSANFVAGRVPRLLAEASCISSVSRSSLGYQHGKLVCRNESISVQVYNRVKCANAAYKRPVFIKEMQPIIVNCVPYFQPL